MANRIVIDTRVKVLNLDNKKPLQANDCKVFLLFKFGGPSRT